jgi:hypothetical protein
MVWLCLRLRCASDGVESLLYDKKLGVHVRRQLISLTRIESAAVCVSQSVSQCEGLTVTESWHDSDTRIILKRCKCCMINNDCTSCAVTLARTVGWLGGGLQISASTSAVRYHWRRSNGAWSVNGFQSYLRRHIEFEFVLMSMQRRLRW